MAAKSNGVLHEMGPQIQWVQSYVTEGKIYCVYIAPDEATIREHAKRGGFPADRVARVVRIIDPMTIRRRPDDGRASGRGHSAVVPDLRTALAEWSGRRCFE